MKSVIQWQGKLLCYESFNQGWFAHFLGNDTPIGISDELREAIEKDQAHQKNKAKPD